MYRLSFYSSSRQPHERFAAASMKRASRTPHHQYRMTRCGAVIIRRMASKCARNLRRAIAFKARRAADFRRESKPGEWAAMRRRRMIKDVWQQFDDTASTRRPAAQYRDGDVTPAAIGQLVTIGMTSALPNKIVLRRWCWPLR